MVVWVFAGGGEAEVRGLLPFLENNFQSMRFVRRLPFRIKKNPRKSPKPSNDEAYKLAQKKNARGATGDGLLKQIKTHLSDAIEYDVNCDLILVIDDLDCKNPTNQCESFIKAIKSVLQEKNKEIPYFVAFAAPEIEAWIIADWDNVISQHPSFRAKSSDIKYCLNKLGVDFSNPEIFSTLNKTGNACKEKISVAIQECCLPVGYYSKNTDSSALLQTINPTEVAKKCPQFRHLYVTLQNFVDKKHITSCCPP